MAMWPTISVFLSMVGAVSGLPLGSQFCVTITGAWFVAEYAAVVPVGVTSTSEVWAPSVSPAYEVKSSRT